MTSLAHRLARRDALATAMLTVDPTLAPEIAMDLAHALVVEGNLEAIDPQRHDLAIAAVELRLSELRR